MHQRFVLRLAMLFALALAVFFMVPTGTRAAEFLTGTNPSVPSDQTIDDDVYAAGGTVTIDGRITRDLNVAGGTVNIAGEVGGNLNVTGGTVTVDGPVRGSIRVFAGTVTIRRPVGWDLVATGGTVMVGPDARVGQDVIAAAGTVTLDGDVGRDVRGSTGTLTINGGVGRNVRIDVDQTLRLGERATINGDLDYTSAQAADIAPGAVVRGETTQRQPTVPAQEEPSTAARILGWLGTFFLRFVWALVVGTIVVLLLPVVSASVADTLRSRPLPSLGWGFVALVVTPVAVLLLLITVIGVPVGLFLLGLYAAALYLSQVVVGLTLGRLLIPGWRVAPTRMQLWITMALGLLIVSLVRLLPIPFGWTFWWGLVIAILALGAIVVYATRRGQAGPAPTGVVPPSPAPAAD